MSGIIVTAGSVKGSLNLAGLWDRIKPAVQRAVEAETAAVADVARQLCPVGSISRPVYTFGPYKGASWTSREPGRLRASIKYRVHWRRDGSACVGWVSAGDHDAFYARFVELGASQAPAQPFLRPAMETADLAATVAAEIMRMGSSGGVDALAEAEGDA